MSRKHTHHLRHKLRNALFAVISCGMILGGSAILWVSTLKIPDLSTFETRKVAQSTKIYDRTGTIILYDIHDTAKRTVVGLADISPFIKNASIATEDANFYHHIGIEPKSIIRAVLANITMAGYSQGGSTITQQVVKNTILTSDKTITRKLKEWVLALKLERVLTKDQILSTYLNETSYGGSIYGVEEASRAFFGISSHDVSLAQAAYIAAIPQAPTYYSPYGNHKKDLDTRKNLVLKRMLDNSFISQAEYDLALKENVTFVAQQDSSIKAPHFSMFVKDYLAQKFGDDTVQQGGLRVVTTLDYTLQKKAEDTIKNFSPALQEKFGASNMGLIAIDPKTGDILAMVGSRDYFDTKIQGNFNITTAHRQPGSSFKPFVYATAFNEGYTPETVLFDVKTEFSSECTPDSKPKNPNDTSVHCYSPNEYDSEFPGPMTMRQALAQSRNVPAVQTLYLAGIKDSLTTARDMGIQGLDDPNRYGLTLVLGGGEVSLLDLTSAYGVFANDGIRNPYRSVLRVEDTKGTVLEDNSALSPAQVLPANTARLISDVLSDQTVRIDSIRDLIGGLGHTIAIKTGTTNDFRDVWTLGYTPQLAVGMWAGNNDNSPIDKSKTAGLVITPVWAGFMGAALQGMSNASFIGPEQTPLDLKPTLRGYWQGGQSYYIDSASGAVATTQTPQELKQEVIANNVHSILYWVDKNNPRGAIPTHPEQDSQFDNWEYAVRTWLTNYKLTHTFTETSTFVVPKNTDTLHGSELAPHVSIVAPDTKAVFNNNDTVVVEIKTSTPAGYPITKAIYYINDMYLGTSTNEPFSFSFIPSDIDNLTTKNTIKVVAYDSVLNKGEDSVIFSLRK